MAKIKYDVSGIEGGSFEQPKPGLYTAKVDECEAGKSKAGNDQLRIILKIADGEFKGSNLFHYVPTDPDAPGAFRMKELITALGAKAKGTLDTDKIVGTAVQVRVKADSYEGEYRARVGSVLAAKNGDEEDEDDDDDDIDEDDDDEPKSKKDEDDDDEDEDDDYDEWSVDELKEELKGRGLKVAGKRSVLIGRLRKDDESEEDPFA